MKPSLLAVKMHHSDSLQFWTKVFFSRWGINKLNIFFLRWKHRLLKYKKLTNLQDIIYDIKKHKNKKGFDMQTLAPMKICIYTSIVTFFYNQNWKVYTHLCCLKWNKLSLFIFCLFTTLDDSVLAVCLVCPAQGHTLKSWVLLCKHNWVVTE